ncbi:DinB family protein [Phyllobacterium sp. SB3]|uniref:DinB family protein n=1 Tax=Phyllobacterium sp. SB3 TaxID=3156073 RepID=UPI0032AED0F2
MDRALNEDVSISLTFFDEKGYLIMSALNLLQTLFSYQAWANNDLFEKIESLDLGLHFKEQQTAVRLINHAYIVGRIFAAHLQNIRHDYSSDNTPETPALAELRAAVSASDQWYLDYLAQLGDEQLSKPIPFIFTDGDKGSMTREEMLLHIVTHSGYHRGEIGRLLGSIGITPPWDTLAVYLHSSEPHRRLSIA